MNNQQYIVFLESPKKSIGESKELWIETGNFICVIKTAAALN
jgi:hypothetical protein